MIWYVYMIECSDGNIYTGVTTNIERRIDEHNSGVGCKYTRHRNPVKLLKSLEFINRSLAMKEEYRIKQLSRKEKIIFIKDLKNSLKKFR